MSKILIFIFDNMTDYEITFISHILSADAGFEIIPIAYEDKIIKSRSGLMYKPLKTVSDVLKDYTQYDEAISQKFSHKGYGILPSGYDERFSDSSYENDYEKHIENIDGIIITGGWYGETKPEFLELIYKLHRNGKLVAGICGAGTVFLAKSGVLENKKYTTPITEWTQKHSEVFGSRDPFPRNNYISERVVRDENVITAQGVAFIDFAVEICDWFNLFEDTNEKDNFYRNFYRTYD